MVDTQSVAPAVPIHGSYRKGGRPTWHQRRRHRCILDLLEHLPAGGKLLDYGCGYGDLPYAMSRRHDVYGVDPDPERAAFGASEYAPLPITQCRRDGLDFPDGMFDIVTSVVVVHFVPDPDQYLREIRRVLRDDGHVVLAAGNRAYLRNFFRRLAGRGPAPVNQWDRSWEEARAFLRGHGFDIVAENYFFDPPSDIPWSLPGVAVGTIEQAISLVGPRELANYYAILARKRSEV